MFPLNLILCIINLFQFIFLASAIGYSKPNYGGLNVSSGGETIGWLIIVTPILIVIVFAVYQVIKRGRPTTGNILSLVRNPESDFTWIPNVIDIQRRWINPCGKIWKPSSEVSLNDKSIRREDNLMKSGINIIINFMLQFITHLIWAVCMAE